MVAVPLGASSASLAEVISRSARI